MLISLITLATFIAAAQGYGRAIVNNQCDAPIWLWSVGSTISQKIKVGKDASYSEIFHSDPKSGGIAIKLTAVDDGIFQPNVSQTIFAYNLDAKKNQVWYDMSDVFGDGFFGRAVNIKPSDTGCASIDWYSGAPPAGSQVKVCQAGTDLKLTFCTNHCLPAWSLCGAMAPNDNRACCTHCIGSHHCVEPPRP
ncbi:uncharacterized protein BDR25DRAFT_256247 [Lindgomyces ingoldianus]|uniref:Uncharacterized protein n=1 Tax=Lindgomyces ingoldianus TaxID=673940 RepID=A0ACB6R5N4_9PLEO|nr:uncharacterized protein BDR25DRAFT_256247 [Lindgomyces ingoldianus]KAF2474390.1 hypothetical protein BDR25DRAFT_256247 [Lindgomyces ingoldianus]